jgi:trans-aconitate 2-methyltransferase
MTDTWNPVQYDKFKREREQPFVDLLALIRPVPGMRIVDLGCGTGALTRQLHERLQARETTGIDLSPRMLEAAQRESLPAGLRFEPGSIESFPSDGAGTYDLVFSNAAFHWVEDHKSLIARLVAALAPSGQLAFQVPALHDDASHRVAEELTGVEPFRSAFAGWHRPQPVLTPNAYASLLYRLGLHEPSVRLIVYPHVLAGPEDVVEWMKGTLLAEYVRRLPADLRKRFVEAYRTRLLPQLDGSRPFFFPFPRILCWGQGTG